MKAIICTATIFSIIFLAEASALSFANRCFSVVASPPTAENPIGQRPVSSFGDPRLVEAKGLEEVKYDIRHYDLTMKTQVEAAEREFEATGRLMKKFPKLFLPFEKCEILKNQNGNEHTLLFFRKKLSADLKSGLISTKLSSMTLKERAGFYGSMAKPVVSANNAGVAHCNLKPASFMDSSSSYLELRLGRLRYVALIDKGQTCAGNSKSFKPYDVSNPECSTPANIPKADSWNLAFAILMLEDRKLNQVDLAQLVKGTEAATYRCFFNGNDRKNCENVIKNLIIRIIGLRAHYEPNEKDRYKEFAAVLSSAFLPCEKRISTEDLYTKLLDISFGTFPKPTQKVQAQTDNAPANHPQANQPNKPVTTHFIPRPTPQVQIKGTTQQPDESPLSTPKKIDTSLLAKRPPSMSRQNSTYRRPNADKTMNKLHQKI